MTLLEVKRDTEWCSMFVDGLPPADLTRQQWQALMELASIHDKRRPDDQTQTGRNGRAGGWNLFARNGEFERLLGIAGAILTNDFGPLAEYRYEAQP
ncbi:hypothetical protein KIH31_01090 [Paenarthrobacter sp. DKR-5]|uniref:hypothetical protein n=1 Tax=Paenarthrobacter sp. DKR-5 TaxID=2835535 RepID=UPI001BDC48D5|nr:hypothetical protein [Paenarthrobacter sp. DKR-5]MBT1001182.1 hypothetical protein [Paenarthrobacter sp. DKR-5]